MKTKYIAKVVSYDLQNSHGKSFCQTHDKVTLYTANVKFQSAINHLYCKVIVETEK